ncbi:2OG-Fe(II) oxygenase family protein [Morganella psychrotolerans]|uniref:Uncharacterized protein n=1 Tax=Morganella psychrotolerans TaxID=368603 RepID=A0A1B8HP93_9GAMM|nr:2OG-Fe(II) oxygenase family protein [Morganella psychrotolerans]OBU11117.1 hypothetical protein AYY18_04090 [Morganella psychrotolerans]
MDIDTLFKTFKKQGYVSFDLGNFFPELTEYSDRFYEICDENWSWIIKNKQGENDFYPKQHPLSLIEKEKRAALSDYTNGLFSFSFRRIVDDHIGNSVIDFFKIKEIVNSKIFIDFLDKITGMEVKESTVIYLNRFDYGDFLTTHSDPGQKFGIVINFTKKWHMEYGGLTMILDHDCKYIIDTLIPYNMSVLVFDTCTKQIPHFVSMVTAKTPHKRIALVVRYD